MPFIRKIKKGKLGLSGRSPKLQTKRKS